MLVVELLVGGQVSGEDPLLVLTPGADWAYAISAGLGGRPVLPAVAGLLRSRPAAARVLTRCSGAVIIAVGAAVLIERLVR